MTSPRHALPSLVARLQARHYRPGWARAAAASWLVGVALLLAACSPPEPPEKDQPPVPKAEAPARHTQLRDAIQAPQDKARAVEGAVDEAAKAQREAIEAAGG